MTSWERIALAFSGVGLPLTQVAIRCLGAWGAFGVEGVVVALLVRDTALIAAGTPSRLRRGPAVLLWLEALAAGCGAVAALPLLVDRDAGVRAATARPSFSESVRRAALGALFGLHTIRFAIYLQPDRGRRSELAAVEA